MFESSKFWIMDSGASKHVCVDSKSFLALHSISNTFVTLPNNLQIPINLNRDVPQCLHLTLKNVLFVPQIRFNLLSISALTK